MVDHGAFERLCDLVGVEPWAEPYHRVLADHENRLEACARLAHIALDAAIITGTFRHGRIVVYLARAAHYAYRQLDVVRQRKMTRHG